jgi:hypothetical protein
MTLQLAADWSRASLGLERRRRHERQVSPPTNVAGMVVETHPAPLRKWSLRTPVEVAREEGEGRRRQRLLGLESGPAVG